MMMMGVESQLTGTAPYKPHKNMTGKMSTKGRGRLDCKWKDVVCLYHMIVNYKIRYLICKSWVLIFLSSWQLC